MADNFLKIAQETVIETQGVASMAFPGVLPMPKDKALDLDVYINVEYGVNIPEVAWNIQERIKEKFSNSTNIKLERINIHVENIHFKEKETYE